MQKSGPAKILIRDGQSNRKLKAVLYKTLLAIVVVSLCALGMEWFRTNSFTAADSQQPIKALANTKATADTNPSSTANFPASSGGPQTHPSGTDQTKSILSDVDAVDETLVPPINLGDEFANFEHGSDAHFHPHGQEVCASGCAASNHPTATLTRIEFVDLMEKFANQPLTEESFALESLLYYGRQTLSMIETYGSQNLDEARLSFLRSQLEFTHADVQIRIVDESGEVRSWIKPTKVPFDRRHVFTMETKNVQNLVTSGTVKRVGLHHMWTRL